MQARKNATPGESRFSKKGYRHKPKVELPLSPFAFRIEEHRRIYDYTEFQLLARHFLLSAMPMLEVHYRQLSAKYAYQVSRSFKNLLQFLSHLKARDVRSEFFVQLSSENASQISDIQWETLVFLWRDSLVTKSRHIRTSLNYILSLKRLWAHLANSNLVPVISIVGYKNARQKGTNKRRRSFAQLTPNASLNSEGVDTIWERISKFFDESEQSEAREFIRSLVASLSAEVVERLSIDEIIEQIHVLNDARLSKLRECAESDFLFWYRHWQRGKASLSSIKHKPNELTYLLDSPKLSLSQRRRNSSTLLFSGPEDHRLGNSLLYVEATVEGVASGIHGRYNQMMHSFGGNYIFHAYLHPHQEATLALWVLMLVDTGANCEVARGTHRDCLEQTKPGYSRIRLGNKLRARGKVIVDELLETPSSGQQISVPQAIRHYLEMSARYRKLAGPKEKDLLLLCEYKSVVSGLKESTGTSWFIKFLKRHKSLEQFDARPSMIRPSVLLSVQHQNSDDVVAAQIIGDHANSSTTLASYTGRAPTTLKYNLLIREFVERYQAVIIATIEGAPEKLGLSADEFKRIFSDASRTGLGVVCLNSMAGIQPGTSPNIPCTRMDACCRCQVRYVVATVENIADLIMFNKYLRESQGQQIEENPDGWEQRWLPWLVFSDIALAKLSKGETAKIFAEAIVFAESRAGNYTPPHLN